MLSAWSCTNQRNGNLFGKNENVNVNFDECDQVLVTFCYNIYNIVHFVALKMDWFQKPFAWINTFVEYFVEYFLSDFLPYLSWRIYPNTSASSNSIKSKESKSDDLSTEKKSSALKRYWCKLKTKKKRKIRLTRFCLPLLTNTATGLRFSAEFHGLSTKQVFFNTSFGKAFCKKPAIKILKKHLPRRIL